MTFSDLVVADMNFRNQERVREGKPFAEANLTEAEISICNILDKIRVYPPGASGLPVEKPFTRSLHAIEPPEVTTVDELGLDL